MSLAIITFLLFIQEVILSQNNLNISSKISEEDLVSIHEKVGEQSILSFKGSMSIIYADQVSRSTIEHHNLKITASLPSIEITGDNICRKIECEVIFVPN